MNNWWKSPVLQGPENDYGDYDYLIEEIPQDYAKWVLSRYKWRCDDCGKERHLIFRSVHWFRTWDGGDSMEYTECWKCRLKTKIYSIKWRFQKQIKIVRAAIELRRMDSSISFSKCYGFAKEIER